MMSRPTHRVGRLVMVAVAQREGARPPRARIPAPRACGAAFIVAAPIRPPTRAARGVRRREGVGQETGNKVFDPLGFSKIASAETLAWYRAAELKHSRVAMVRTTHAPSLGI